MARARVVKRLCEAFKGTVSTGFSVHPVVSPKLLHGSLPRSVNVDGPAGKTFTHRVNKKVQSRIRRASRFGDHGSSAAFKKVVRRRDRINASTLGLPSSPPIAYHYSPRSSEYVRQLDSPRPVSSRTEGVQSISLPSAIKDDFLAACMEPLDEMEDVVPAPVIYHRLVSLPVRPAQSLPLVGPPNIAVYPARAQELHCPPPSQSFPAVPPAPAARSPILQPRPPAPRMKQVPHSQPTQPMGQLPPTMSYFCRNLSQVPVSKETTYVLRALSTVEARERCALASGTTPPTPQTQPSRASAALVRLPPVPTKVKPPHSRPGALYAELYE